MEGKLWEKGLDRQFFRLIHDHAMQGFYGSPRHGGNKNNVSYKMMRLDYPVIIGQNRYNN
jgi:gluconate 2-dehydrogenase gamma chain